MSDLIFEPITKQVISNKTVTENKIVKKACLSTINLYKRNGASMPWIGYLCKKNGKYVGTCAFKNIPHSKSVEIIYYTFPKFEGKGIATQMAQYLVQIAQKGKLQQVTAQTKPQESPATTVLRKLGFQNIETINHPVDGEVWTWRKKL
ncbi:MAG: GNAT family N-acetyltransferase [Hyphomicrobiales bacterium]